jgi:hypothetical protein
MSNYYHLQNAGSTPLLVVFVPPDDAGKLLAALSAHPTHLAAPAGSVPLDFPSQEAASFASFPPAHHLQPECCLNAQAPPFHPSRATCTPSSLSTRK